MKDLKEYVRNIPDFPSKGIIFRDITTILQDKDALKLAIDKMQESYMLYMLRQVLIQK